jgi:hypothetical protein
MPNDERQVSLESILGLMTPRSLLTALVPPGYSFFLRSFNGKLRDECLNEQVFSSLAEARRIIEYWRIDYNTARPQILDSKAAEFDPATFRDRYEDALLAHIKPKQAPRHSGTQTDLCPAASGGQSHGTPATSFRNNLRSYYTCRRHRPLPRRRSRAQAKPVGLGPYSHPQFQAHAGLTTNPEAATTNVARRSTLPSAARNRSSETG